MSEAFGGDNDQDLQTPWCLSPYNHKIGHCLPFLKTTKWEEFYNSRSFLLAKIQEAKSQAPYLK